MTKVHEFTDSLRNIVRTPAAAALLTGGALYGVSRLAYPWVAGAIQHTSSVLGMGDRQSQEELAYELNTNKSRHKIPLILAALGSGLVAASSYNPSPALKWGGLFDRWDDPRRAISTEGIKRAFGQGHNKAASSSMFSWDMTNDQTDLDFGKLIPIKMANDVVFNDPNTEIYQKGNALDIINKAAQGSHNGKMTAGSLFDSALNKVQNNLTMGGVTNAAVRATIGYGMAKAFTNTMCSLVDMPKPLRDGIVTLGMVSNVIQGLD